MIHKNTLLKTSDQESGLHIYPEDGEGGTGLMYLNIHRAMWCFNVCPDRFSSVHMGTWDLQVTRTLELLRHFNIIHKGL